MHFGEPHLGPVDAPPCIRHRPFGMAFPSAFLRRTLRPWRDRPVDSRFSANRDAMDFDFDCDSPLALFFRLTKRTHRAYYGFAPFVNMHVLDGDLRCVSNL